MIYYVIKSVRKVTDNTISCAVTSFDSLDNAKKKFHGDLNETIGNEQYNYAMETLLNETGIVEQREVWYMAEEEPEPEPETEA